MMIRRTRTADQPFGESSGGRAFSFSRGVGRRRWRELVHRGVPASREERGRLVVANEGEEKNRGTKCLMVE